MQKKRKVVGPAIVGNIVEYYDFGVYAVYAVVISNVFFPAVMPDHLRILYTFSIFAMGFFMRPLGGIFFGYIGDKFGRKASLTISILGMAFCTFGIGLLPGYETIGVLAPLLLILMRMFQGLCVGGEGAAVAIFILEHTEGYRPGLMGSIVMASNMVGTLLATFVAIIIKKFFGDETMYWRYAFFLGGFIGLIGLYMRYSLSETPAFEAKKKNNQLLKNPLKEAFRTHWKSMLLVLFLGGTTSAVAYTIRGYLTAFFTEVMFYPREDALFLTSIALFCMIVFMPLFGIVADKMGYRKFFFTVCYTVIFTIIPVFMLIANPIENIGYVMLGILLLSALASAICAPAYPYAIKSFEVELRFSGVASSWNLGNALLGGTTPAICVYFTEVMHTPIAPAFYLIVVSLALIIVKYWTTRGHKPHVER
jgi:MHS family proline/betaine transporter-like MFS transporter